MAKVKIKALKNIHRVSPGSKLYLLRGKTAEVSPELADELVKSKLASKVRVKSAKPGEEKGGEGKDDEGQGAVEPAKGQSAKPGEEKGEAKNQG